MENMHTDIMVQNFKARRPRLAARFRLTHLVIFAIPGESGKLADVEIEKGTQFADPTLFVTQRVLERHNTM